MRASVRGPLHVQEPHPNGERQFQGFSDLARRASHALGSAWAFLAACAAVLLWLISGPLFGFSDAWQLVINTGTTIVTFLMVFLIQNTQNRDARALHLKLDELIRSIQAARNLVDRSRELHRRGTRPGAAGVRASEGTGRRASGQVSRTSGTPALAPSPRGGTFNERGP